ncbi:MAG: UDP-N-acetylglucosamine diphosphorylase/glucosamine-1-phosphate N-acetyltransferase [SAR86 cluster bacterium]|uniref:Bifunctional protein GlmU n=1 Tax=SAR86 cluster bacterium TaxID=2030880 RepID=A0A2A5CJM0_9GAMM|nr:MAG: UDP-N-acetylglucosamine diphosphorylase/glucosamine-1-phosphate N-acetyltransferase [SAR86 cluster bacterium]
MLSKLNVVILAAGKGSRMYSETPKVLHELAGTSLVEHVIAAAQNLNPDNITLVLGHQADELEAHLAGRGFNFALQKEQKGTAHAVEQALPFLDDEAHALILYGDVPLTKTASLEKLLALCDKSAMAVLTSDVKNPEGLGRIIRDGSGNIKAIVEEKDTDDTQKNITEINTGIMAFPVKKLKQWLPKIKNNNSQNEYYLTDIVSLALEDEGQVKTSFCADEYEAYGINNMLQLASLEKIYQYQQASKFMLKGVKIIDPSRFDVRGEVNISADVKIDINVILEGKVDIEKNVKIGANCILKNCTIQEGTEIYPNTLIEESEVGKNCKVGPFARIRPGTELKNDAKIGNFVETKKVLIGRGSKINHLSYIGDSELGEKVNVGAGTITCNYDGVNKFKTKIGNNVFIGSNTALVAPLIISDGATIGAGSTITKDVKADQLALTRTQQNNIDGWKRPGKK